MSRSNIDERILDCMEELARQKGFVKTTTDELAAAAGISKRTLYRYYPSKEAVIQAVINRMTGRIESSMLQVLESSIPPPEKLRQSVEVIYRNLRFMDNHAFVELKKYYPRLWTYLDEYRASRIQFWETILHQGVKEGYFREVDPRFVLTVLLASVRAVITPDFVYNNSLSLSEAFQRLVDLFLYGINKRPGS